MRRIAKALAAPLSTTGRWLKSMGLGRLKNLQPKEAVRRYQWAQPSDMCPVSTTLAGAYLIVAVHDMIHVDT